MVGSQTCQLLLQLLTNHDANPSGPEPGSRLADLAGQLALSPQQVAKMSTALSEAYGAQPAPAFEPEKVQSQMQAFASAFEAASFDARSLLDSSAAPLSTHGATRLAKFYAAVAPFLEPDQGRGGRGR